MVSYGATVDEITKTEIQMNASGPAPHFKPKKC